MNKNNINPEKFDKIEYNTNVLPIRWHYDTVHGDNNYGSYMNWHKEIEFLYFTEGEAEIICNSNHYKIKPGMLATIFPFAMHRVMNSTSECKFHCIIVDTEFISSEKIWHKNNDIAITDSESCSIQIKQIIEDLEFNLDAPKALFQGQFLALTTRLIQVSQLSTVNSLEKSQLKSIRKAIEYIQENYSKDITISDMCDVSNMKKSNFSEYFKKFTNYSFVNYLNIIRCERAYNLLSSTDTSVQKTAELCGFNNFSYFSKKFKSIYNCLPSDIKRKDI